MSIKKRLIYTGIVALSTMALFSTAAAFSNPGAPNTADTAATTQAGSEGDRDSMSLDVASGAERKTKNSLPAIEQNDPHDAAETEKETSEERSLETPQGDNVGSSGAASASSPDDQQALRKATSLETAADRTPKNTTTSTPASSTASGKQKKWIDPVYQEIHHEEVGHYEPVQKVKCKCGIVFNNAGEHKAHQDAFIESERQRLGDPTFTCNGTHTARYVTENIYIVDQPAYTETVLISEGHWE